MTKKFTQSIFILLFLNLLIKPFWIFGIDRTIQNRVGAEEYGLFFSLFSFSLLLNMLSDLGITNYNNRYIAQNQGKLSRQLGMIIPLKLILGILYCIVTLLLAFLLGYSNRQFELLIWLIVNQMLSSFILFLRSNISALQLFNTDSLLSVIDKLLTIILCGLLLWANFGLTFKIEWLIYSQTIAYSATLTLVLFIVFRKSGRLDFGLNLKTIIHTLKSSFPFALLAILMMLYTRIDAVMLERMLPDGKTEAGIYAQAFRISDVLSMFAFLFASILLPLLAKMLNENSPIGATLSHSFALLMVPSVALTATLLFSVKEFMDLLYQHHSSESAKVLFYLLIGFLGICLSYIFGTLLTAAGKLKILNQIAFFGLLLNVILNLFLIPKFDTVGAAASSAITQTTIGIVQAIVSIKTMKIRIKIVTPLYYFGLVAVSTLLAFLAKLTIPWYLTFFVVPILILIIGFALKLIKIDNLRNLLEKNEES